MLLGKRPRAPMKRTTSFSEMALDLNTVPDSDPTDPFNQHGSGPGPAAPHRVHRRNCSDLIGTPDFLRSCSRCRRRLVSGRDIYMYRGNTAFCSLECREEQINQDEKKEKMLFVTSKKKIVASPSGSKVTAKSETTVVAL